MHIAFLYPRDMITPRHVDEMFLAEFNAAQQAGLSVHIFDIDNILTDVISPALPEGSRIVYRGWMLNESRYDQLEQRFHNALLVPKNTYLAAHYLPNWYIDVHMFTMATIITTEEEAHKEFDTYTRKMFIKDYVKSLKTGKGSVVDSKEDIIRAIADMKKYRGYVEEGIVLREFVELISGSEQRFFIVHNTIFGPQHDKKIIDFVNNIVKKLENKLFQFYTIDIALKLCGDPILIEIGDGQVSDYVGWEINDFISVLKQVSI